MNKKFFLKNLGTGKFTGFLFAAIAIFSLYSCSEDDNSLNEDNARLMVRLTDAPGDYDAVFVDVVDVMIQRNATAGEDEGWTSLPNVQAQVYNLLELTGGITQLLADAEVPAGTLSQIRLVLGDNNSVVVDGETQPLSTPSAQQSGLKMMVNTTLEAGETYEFLMDFDVDQSIVSAGTAGGYLLKPVIRLTEMEGTGTIMGEVQPSLSQAVVRAQNATHTISAYTDENGIFSLNGVPGGTYQIRVTPDASTGYQAITRNNIVVAPGATVELDPFFFE